MRASWTRGSPGRGTSMSETGLQGIGQGGSLKLHSGKGWGAQKGGAEGHIRVPGTQHGHPQWTVAKTMTLWRERRGVRDVPCGQAWGISPHTPCLALQLSKLGRETRKCLPTACQALSLTCVTVLSMWMETPSGVKCPFHRDRQDYQENRYLH